MRVTLLVGLLGACGPAAVPAKPVPVPDAAPAATTAPEDALAAAVEDEKEVTCVAFAEARGPHLCLAQGEPLPDGGAIGYTLALLTAKGNGWQVADTVEELHSRTAHPALDAHGETEMGVKLGDIHDISPTERAIELVLTTAWSYDEEGGQSENTTSTLLYWPQGGELVEILRVDSTAEASTDFDESQEQSLEIQDDLRDGFYTIVVTTRRVENQWPVNQSTDETTQEILIWNGAGYDREPLAPAEDLDDAEEDEAGAGPGP